MRKWMRLHKPLDWKAQFVTTVRAATSHATKDLTLISDRVASSAFRAHLTTVLTERAIHRAVSRAV